jgi:alpha-maltose-1-phosphate synthase
MDSLNITLVNLWPVGGMMHYTAQLSAALAKQDRLKITVVLPVGTDISLFSPDVRLRLVDVPVKASLGSLIKLITGIAFIKLYRAIADTRPDVIHLNSSHLLMLLTLPLLARKYHIVATIHDATSHPGSDRNLRKHLERQVVVNNAKCFFVHREVIKQQFLDLNPAIDKDQVLVTPHGDFDFFNDAQHTAQANSTATEEPATLLFFGRISIYKGLIHLVQAVSQLRDKHPQLKVIIAGSGTFETDVAKAVRDDIYEVHNRFIDDDEVAGFFQRASILVLPYIEASESGVIQVGKAFTKPIVSTRVGGIPEAVIDGSTGIIVEPGDSSALAVALDRLLSDASERERMKQNIQKESDQRPGWKEASAIIAAAYESVAYKH